MQEPTLSEIEQAAKDSPFLTFEFGNGRLHVRREPVEGVQVIGVLDE
jgi:hypothetical protein